MPPPAAPWLALTTAVLADDKWEPVRKIVSSTDAIWTQNLSKGFVFTAGDASGRKFTYESPGSEYVKAEKRMLLASASKFPAALAIAGAVADGHLTFDTHAHEVFDWWSANASDPRSGVTLRQLLSFTSGFYWKDASSGAAPCMTSLAGASRYTAEECAKQIYEDAPFPFAPGTTFAYNSFHLQLAGAMAAKAARLSLQDLLHKYLIGKLKLNRTAWLGGQNPQLAAAMTSTADDYDTILQKYLAYELVPEAVADDMERCADVATTRPDQRERRLMVSAAAHAGAPLPPPVSAQRLPVAAVRLGRVRLVREPHHRLRPLLDVQLVRVPDPVERRPGRRRRRARRGAARGAGAHRRHRRRRVHGARRAHHAQHELVAAVRG